MSRKLDYAIGLVALVGVGVASYLVYVHYAGIEPFCVSGGGCEKVQSSSYSSILGVPVALLGLIGYAAIIGSLFVPGEVGRGTTAVLALSGFGFSVYLTYLELFRINAICQWCVVSAILMTILMVLAMIRFLSAPPSEGVPEAADEPASEEEPTGA